MNKIIGLILVIAIVIWGIQAGDGRQVAIFISESALVSVFLVLVLAGGLTLISYRKGIGRNRILLRLKKYLIFSGCFWALVGAIQLFRYYQEITLETVQKLIPGFSVVLLTLFFGYIFAYILDAFITEED
jgi:hypothetical protein